MTTQKTHKKKSNLKQPNNSVCSFHLPTENVNICTLLRSVPSWEKKRSPTSGGLGADLSDQRSCWKDSRQRWTEDGGWKLAEDNDQEGRRHHRKTNVVGTREEKRGGRFFLFCFCLDMCDDLFFFEGDGFSVS